jgi:hypothetical protein
MVEPCRGSREQIEARLVGDPIGYAVEVFVRDGDS